MSFTLTDLSSENFEFSANVWNWKAAVEVIRSLDILGDGALRQMNYNATGVKISADDAHEIGSRIQKEWLPKLLPNFSRGGLAYGYIKMSPLAPP